MPNAIWKGHISFGLVSIPIILYSAEETSSHVSFHQIDTKNNARIRYERINTITGKKVAWEDIGKGYEVDKDQIIPVKKGELEKVAGENAKTIEIESFIDKKNIDFIMVNKTYFLVPDKKGDKGYVLLREALKDSNKIGIAKLLISTKEYLAAVAVYENALVIYTLHYADEIRKLSDFDIPESAISKYKINKKEIDIAKQLIQSMTVKWKPENYKDEFKEQVSKWLDKKLKNLPFKSTKKRTPLPPSTNVVNFMDLLKKSLKTKKPARNDPHFKAKKTVSKKVK